MKCSFTICLMLHEYALFMDTCFFILFFFTGITKADFLAGDIFCTYLFSLLNEWKCQTILSSVMAWKQFIYKISNLRTSNSIPNIYIHVYSTKIINSLTQCWKVWSRKYLHWLYPGYKTVLKTRICGSEEMEKIPVRVEQWEQKTDFLIAFPLGINCPRVTNRILAVGHVVLIHTFQLLLSPKHMPLI